MLVIETEPGFQICCLIPLSAEASSHTIYPNDYNHPAESGRTTDSQTGGKPVLGNTREYI